MGIIFIRQTNRNVALNETYLDCDQIKKMRYIKNVSATLLFVGIFGGTSNCGTGDFVTMTWDFRKITKQYYVNAVKY